MVTKVSITVLSTGTNSVAKLSTLIEDLRSMSISSREAGAAKSRMRSKQLSSSLKIGLLILWDGSNGQSSFRLPGFFVL